MFSHSNLEDMWRDHISGRWAIKASHRIKINPIKATKEIAEPMDDKAFHCMYMSA